MADKGLAALAGSRAFLFDVFGTVVDWHGGVVREAEALARDEGITGVDWGAFVRAWRMEYAPIMARVNAGARPWATLDTLQRATLEGIRADFGLAEVAEAGLRRLVAAWRALDPWPDSVAGLARLRRRYLTAAVSNASMDMLIALARRGGYVWDAPLGSHVAGAFKPAPRAYLTAARMLGLRPQECVMTAAHESDLAAAKALGFKTAYVIRPQEWGSGAPSGEPKRAEEWDCVVSDLCHLADLAGA